MTNPNNKKSHIIVVGQGGGGHASSVDWDDIQNKPTLYNEWFGTQAEYDLIDPKDPDTIYHIEGNNNLTYRAFPQGWHTTGTMADLISDINNDSNAVVGMSYMDTVSFSDLPTGMQQGEIQVDVVSEQTGLGKVLNFTLKSSNLSPYHWEYTSAYGAAGTWRGFMPNTTLATVATTGNYSDLNGTPTIPTNTSDLNNDSGYITISDVPAQVNADWNESDSTSPAYIENKPSTETLTFTLANNTTVTIEVYVKPQPVYNYFYVEDASGNGSTLTIEQADGQLAPQIEVFKSSDQINWTSMGTTDPNTPLTASVPANGKVYLKATANQWSDNTGHRNQLNCDEDFNIGGNIMSLLAGDNYEGATLDSNYSHQFYWMMNQSNVVDASNLVLPSNVTADCYNGMFWHCASMTKAPELPAQTLADRCYFWMFDTCQSLDGLTVYADDNSASDCTNNWLYDAAVSADFYNLGQATYTLNDPSGVPTGWTYHTSL